MHPPPLARRGLVALSTAALATTGMVTLAPVAGAAGEGLIINEVYGGGGNSGATLTNDFVELYNPTDQPISLADTVVSYYSSSGNLGNACALSGTVEPGAHFLVQQAAGSGGTTPLPTPDAECGASMSGSNGSVELTDGDTTVDLVGYGSATLFEGNRGPGLSNATSASRTDFVDTDDNAADFTAGAPSPQNSGGDGTDPDPDPGPDPDPVPASIADIQGPGDTSPLVDQVVQTTGVVTAVYPTGGFDGAYLQTAGSGGDAKVPGEASDGIFLYLPGETDSLAVGDCLNVEATVVEFFTLTQLADAEVTDAGTCDAVQSTPLETLPTTDAEKEVYEGMLVTPQGTHTITNNYQLNQYGQIGLAVGEEPLYQATDMVLPGADAEAYEAANLEKYITLDDGSSWDYLRNSTAQGSPLPYLSQEEPHRTGSQVTFDQPVILDYRFQWNYQPTGQVIGAESDVDPIVSENDREAQTPDVGGDIQIGAFNVLNYFSDLGQDEAGCDFYPDRFGDPVGTDFCEVRGAWSQDAFEDQQAKLVTAINGTDAEVLGLMEIENSAGLSYIDHPRDKAVADLVAALNDDAGETRWAFAPSPTAVPPGEDIIRTAFIYDPDQVELSGPSFIQLDEAFANARYPLAQKFTVTSSGEDFVAVANHFKSKGSGEDDGTGQGLANPSRIAQAEALSAWSEEMFPEDALFLMGDFNAYSREDPIRVLEDAGYTNLARAYEPSSATYQFSGRLGSLDHVMANASAQELVTGAAVWDINGDESIAFQYSRRNYNVTDFHSDGQFASSDHDPVLVGLGDDSEGAGVPVERVSGDDRYKTAARIAQEYPEGVDTVYIATGNQFADALSGAAAASQGIVPATATARRAQPLVAPDGSPAPILLTRVGDLPAVTANTLDDIDPSNIVILGGEVAVSEKVETQLEEYGTVTRLAGDDRYKTSAAVARQYGQVEHVYVATGEGENFPDALSGSALAASEGVPVLLSRTNSVPGALTQALDALGDPEVRILGGGNAVTDTVFNQLDATERIEGKDRYGTSVAVAERFGYTSDNPAAQLYVATGLDYPDALAGSALAGYQDVPVMLTRPGDVPKAILDTIVEATPAQVNVLGGTTALPDTIITALDNALNP